MWWLILGIFIGASVRLEPSTGPCTLAEAGMAAPLPDWMWPVSFGIALVIAAPLAVLMYRAQIMPAAQAAAAARAKAEAAYRAYLNTQEQG